MVHDARAAHNVDRLVRVFRDVICTSAIELDEEVVDWVLQRPLDVRVGSGLLSVKMGAERATRLLYGGMSTHQDRSCLPSLLVAALHHRYQV